MIPLSAGALQLAGFLLAHGFWTISAEPAGEHYVPQALCETAQGDRRLITFGAPSEDESLAQAKTFMGSTAGQFAECAFSQETEVETNQGNKARALMIDLVSEGRTLTIVQAYRPAAEGAAFQLLGDELMLDDGGVVLPRSMSNPAIVALREGAADHPGLGDQWIQWNTGRDPVNPLVK